MGVFPSTSDTHETRVLRILNILEGLVDETLTKGKGQSSVRWKMEKRLREMANRLASEEPSYQTPASKRTELYKLI